jgi:hypothetical protein
MPTSNTKRPYSTTERAQDGATVTLVNLNTQELKVWTTQGFAYETKHWQTGITRHAYGFLDQMRDLCARVEALGGEWRIRTISTPQTIYADIKGRDVSRNGFGANSPESELLGSMGYLHLWERYETLDMDRVLQKRTARRRYWRRHTR